MMDLLLSKGRPANQPILTLDHQRSWVTCSSGAHAKTFLSLFESERILCVCVDIKWSEGAAQRARIH